MKRDSLSHVLKKRRSRAFLPSPPLPEKGARGAGHSLRESNPRHSPLGVSPGRGEWGTSALNARSLRDSRMLSANRCS